VAVFAAVPASAEMKTEWVEYSQGGMKLKAYMAYDDKITGRRPAVFVVHAREGMTPKTQQLTELWAKLGYVAFATDMFGYGQGIPLTKVNSVVDDLRGAKVPFQLEVYSGTGHGFSSPKGKDEERANAQSIASTTRTMKELFGI